MPSSPSQDRPVVLLLEEEDHERVVITEHLTEGGFEVIGAADSDEALKALKSRKDIRVFVTDAHVPGSIDGHELARTVREKHPGIATVMISGHSDAKSGPVPEGATFIAKPYLLEHLLPTLRQMLDGS
jgi:DNA-binding NtrC family response regulator